uniref:Serine protease inhibitor n=1 Tax=Amblyomma americanum TaxID=6943 RepID=A0A0E9Y2Z9_AMBAM
MMYQQSDYKMSRSDDLEVTALEIPYRGGKTSMVVLLPDSVEGLSKLEDSLTTSNLSDLLKNFRNGSDVELYLPKFKLEQAIDLKETMKAMGIKDFFTAAADLRGISDKRNLVASEVIHKAFVGDPNSATEAAAATAVVMMCYSLPMTTRFVVDRPFMFLIRSLDPELVLFMGSVRQL